VWVIFFRPSYELTALGRPLNNVGIGLEETWISKIGAPHDLRIDPVDAASGCEGDGAGRCACR
jgi:hypothetical protein